MDLQDQGEVNGEEQRMVFDDEGYPADEDSDIGEEDLIKQLIS